MPYKAVITLYSENHTKHTDSVDKIRTYSVLKQAVHIVTPVIKRLRHTVYKTRQCNRRHITGYVKCKDVSFMCTP